MTAPSEKLARSLNALHLLQERGVVTIRAADLPRTHRERLVRHGFLQPVMKGWYIAVSPDRSTGDSTAWYTSFRSFCAAYLRTRFGARWCLSPEQSLALHAGNRTVPSQLLVRAPKGRNRVTALLHGTSLLEVRAALPDAEDVVELDGMRAFSLSAALIACAAGPGTPTATQKIGRIAPRSPPAATGRRTKPCAAAFAEWPKARTPGTVAEEDHRIWRREMFAPSVAAGLARPADLGGYRNTPVYIQRSMHVPPSPPAVRDAMPAFFDLLRDEPAPSVRVVLGHFLFIHVHPCPDGNGRIGRFLMNVILAAAGWPWTITPVERGGEYMAALEAASGDRWRGRRFPRLAGRREAGFRTGSRRLTIR